MTLQFSEEDLLRELGAAAVDKGELLWIDDRVRQVQVVAGGTLRAQLVGNPADKMLLLHLAEAWRRLAERFDTADRVHLPPTPRIGSSALRVSSNSTLVSVSELLESVESFVFSGTAM